MALLDRLLGQVLGGMTQSGGGFGRSGGFGRMPLPGYTYERGAGGNLATTGLGILLMLGLQLLQRNGGIEGVLGKLRQKGYGREADSWVSTGSNKPITADALSEVFGRDEVDSVAREMGVDPQDALGGLADVFPEIVNEMTPAGRVESDSDDVVEKALRTLRERQQRG